MAKRTGKNARPANRPATPVPERSTPDFAQVVAGLIHDLRAPLGTVVGAASTIEDYGNAIDERTRSRLCASIVTEAQRLDHLLTALAAIAKARAGSLNGEARAVELNELLQGMSAKLRERAGARLRISLESQDIFVVADPAVIRTLILAMLDFALEYAREDAELEVGILEKAESAILFVTGGIPKARHAGLRKLLGEAAPHMDLNTVATSEAVFLAAAHELVHILRGEFCGRHDSNLSRLQLSACLSKRLP